MPLSDAPARVDSSRSTPHANPSLFDRATICMVAPSRMGRVNRAAVGGAGVARSTCARNAPCDRGTGGAGGCRDARGRWLRRILLPHTGASASRARRGRARGLGDFLGSAVDCRRSSRSPTARSKAFQTDLRSRSSPLPPNCAGRCQLCPRTLSIAEDETERRHAFGGSDAVSNFILLEHRSDARSAAA